MLVLIRENSHDNDISIYYDSIKKKYYKISTTNYGDNLIKNEIEGINFFNELINKKKIIYKLYKKKKYRRLEINQINGSTINYTESFYDNSKYFQKIINFYLTEWPSKKKQPAHGDLTLDNILFYKTEFTIFDWEHFKTSNELFFGYDLIYLLLSGIILPGEKKFDLNSKNKFRNLYKQLYNNNINRYYLDNPFKSIDKIISNVFTSILLKSPKKFITISINKNFKGKIIDYMTEEIFDK